MIGRASSMLVLATLVGSCGGSDAGPQPPPPNAPPVFSSPASVSVTSGATGTVYTASASDPEGTPLSYGISGGADQALFQIGPAGAVSFRTAPDAAAPADQDRNNVYLIRLSASDGQATATLDVAVTVVSSASGFRVRRVATGFDQLVFLDREPGSDRVFVIERGGRVLLLDPATGAVPTTPFLDIANDLSTDGEGGLLGFATAPDYQTSRSFYVFLTNRQGTIEVRRYRRSAGNPDLADGASADIILTVPHPGFTNHYGGFIGFGADGLLYVATGDGGGAGDPNDNAQNPNRLLGKILRIDPIADDFPADPNRDYRIPPTNPFAGGNGAREVLALGLRNPFRASFDETSLLIGDVGQGALEELDRLVIDRTGPAINFGWPILEGTRAFRGGGTAGLTPPFAEYAHGTGPLNGQSVTGGVLYQGPVASLRGSYVFGDFVRPRLWTLPRALTGGEQTTPSSAFVDRLQSFAPGAGAYSNIVSFGTDRAGNLYIVDFDGEIFRLEATN